MINEHLMIENLPKPHWCIIHHCRKNVKGIKTSN